MNDFKDALDKIDADYLVQLARQEVRTSPSLECMEREPWEDNVLVIFPYMPPYLTYVFGVRSYGNF